jgi:hypothetical protein
MVCHSSCPTQDQQHRGHGRGKATFCADWADAPWAAATHVWEDQITQFEELKYMNLQNTKMIGMEQAFKIQKKKKIEKEKK